MKVLLENENLDSEKIVNSTRIMIKPSLPKYVFHKPRWKLGELNFNSLLNDLDDMGGCTIPEFFCGLAYSKMCCEISSVWKADICQYDSQSGKKNDFHRSLWKVNICQEDS